jgi:hypothetical protein
MSKPIYFYLAYNYSFIWKYVWIYEFSISERRNKMNMLYFLYVKYKSYKF